jgi:hypothetical protein
MAYFGSSDQLIQVSTGNVRTALDKFDSTMPNNAARNPLGAPYFDNAVSAAAPNGIPTKYRYVRYNSTANAAVQANPAAVWWTDNTFTTVTGTKSESWGGQSSFAGVLMLNSTDLTTLTATILNGNYCFIAVAGYVKAVVSPAAAAGDQLFASATDWTTNGGFTKVTVGAATAGRIAAFTYGASASDVLVYAESM